MNNLYNKAISLHRSKNFLEAEKIYQTILNNDPNNSEIFYLLGVLKFQLEGFTKAIMISKNKNYYQNIILKLKFNKAMLSDANSYAQHLEKAYKKSIENYMNNLSYENIYIN